ncbi:tyrosine-type recombinase/integrase [candidate division KSB1 bacterium]
MPTTIRKKTNYPGVYYIESQSKYQGKSEKIFYIRYRKDGQQIEEKAGRQFQDDMTPARASILRNDRITGKKPSRKEIRTIENNPDIKWTINRLWEAYKQHRTTNKSLSNDEYRYNKYLKSLFGDKEPKKIELAEVDNFRKKISRDLSPQTVKHTLNLLTWIINFGIKNSFCPPLSIQIKKPPVNNVITEDLTSEQISKLLIAIEQDENEIAKNVMMMALFTGMRRTEILNLKWSDINFERKFLLIRDPKGGLNQKIPLNSQAESILTNIEETKYPYIFPNADGTPIKNIYPSLRRIREKAGLPKDFRPLHGLRHVYASMLASSGKVDMYTLQKLLTHKSPQMTQRYAHLRDEALKKAADLAGEIIEEAGNKSNKVK